MQSDIRQSYMAASIVWRWLNSKLHFCKPTVNDLSTAIRNCLLRPDFNVPELIRLKNSDYGICIGQVFVGCVLYADDIALLSASCYGLQKLVTMCKLYGEAWDIM